MPFLSTETPIPCIRNHLTLCVQLRAAWISERCSATLLPFCQALPALVHTVTVQNELFSGKDTASEGPSPLLRMEKALYAMDIERCRFLCAAYARIRLRKIEAQWAYLLRSAPDGLLSLEEKGFLQSYAKLRENHLAETVLARMPDIAKRTPADAETFAASMQPSERHHVFIRTTADITRETESTQPVEVTGGTHVLVQYRYARDAISDGTAAIS